MKKFALTIKKQKEMKKFVLTTKSESGDCYIYFIEHDKVPTHKELVTFLKENASDVDEDGYLYEHVDEIEEIGEFLRIPKKSTKK